LLELKIFLDLLTDELGQTAQGTPLIDLLAQRLEVTNWTLSRAIEMTLLSNEKSIQELITIALEKQSLKSLYGSRKNDLIQKQLRSGDAPASVSIFLSRIKNQFPLLIPLSPLSSLSGKDDIQGALQIFGYSNNPGDDELKKQYKKLASARHPDRILSLNPGAVAIKTASDNFAKIQAAWDILKK
jgi:DnaJ-domain-containing protein 1